MGNYVVIFKPYSKTELSSDRNAWIQASTPKKVLIEEVMHIKEIGSYTVFIDECKRSIASFKTIDIDSITHELGEVSTID